MTRPGLGGRSPLRSLVAAGAVALAGAIVPVASADEVSAVAALRAGGHVLVLRHAVTDPGVGDPPGFRVEDCATQRNLSEQGRRDAARLGASLRAEGVAVTETLSSGWCRCLDTARLAFGAVRRWEPLDSFFDERSAEPARTAAVRTAVAQWRGPGTLALVTHQVNIAALAGEVVGPNEAVVLRPGGGSFTLVGRVRR